jgi:hypothetical protein
MEKPGGWLAGWLAAFSASTAPDPRQSTSSIHGVDALPAIPSSLLSGSSHRQTTIGMLEYYTGMFHSNNRSSQLQSLTYFKLNPKLTIPIPPFFKM